MGQNKLTVYSNGVTQVQRFIPVKGRTPINIPVRKSSVADVLATLGVYGKVKLVEPPSYNNDASQNTLHLSPDNIRNDLATKLSGAAVKITEYAGGDVTIGTLAGIQTRTEYGKSGETAERPYLQALTKDGNFASITDSNIKTVEFTQPEVQALIKKALAKNFENVRPDSVLVSLAVEPSSSGDTEAMLDYTTLTAAWQSVYKLRVATKKDQKTTLEYNAKLDNPTDEDFLGTKVAVVVGEPISLDTTLNEAIIPSRTKVSLVNKQALGPVRTQEAIQSKGMLRMASVAGGRGRRGPQGPQGSKGAVGMESLDDDQELEAIGGTNYCALQSFGAVAESAGATAEEVGDFAKFESNDVIDIRANLGGVINLFTADVEAKEVLFFDAKQDRERAYRGIRLTNTTPNTLGSGIITAYLGDLYAGQAEMTNLKPGKAKTLVFSRENGVDVLCKPGDQTGSRIEVGMANGELWWQDRQGVVTEYHFENLRKDAEFEVEINHVFGLPNAEFKVSNDAIKVEKTKTGLKLTGTLPADGGFGFTVSETLVSRSAWIVTGIGGYNNFIHFFDEDPSAAKLKKTPGYEGIEKRASECRQIEQQINAVRVELQQSKEEQTRLLALVQAGSSASQLDKWQTNLDKSEDRIKDIERKELPALLKSKQDAEAALTTAQKAFAFSWAAGEEAKK